MSQVVDGYVVMLTGFELDLLDTVLELHLNGCAEAKDATETDGGIATVDHLLEAVISLDEHTQAVQALQERLGGIKRCRHENAS